MTTKRKIFPNSNELIQATVEFIIACAQEAIEARNKFHIALSGGSTPKEFHALLAQPEYADQIDWNHVHVYFGDERVVPQNHPDSNYLMARKTLLNHVPIPANNTHPIPIHIDNPQAGAQEYEQLLLKQLPQDRYKRPVFDLVLLGMGPDGHTASLFPGTDILDNISQRVAAVYVPKFESWRISLTFPVLNAARNILMVVSGKEKADVIAAIKDSNTPMGTYPVQKIVPTGTMYWYLDQDAASGGNKG
jgi:6-phosphogluconolactonase